MGTRSRHSVTRRRELLPSNDTLIDLLSQVAPKSGANRVARRRAGGVLRRYVNFVNKHGARPHLTKFKRRPGTRTRKVGYCA